MRTLGILILTVPVVFALGMLTEASRTHENGPGWTNASFEGNIAQSFPESIQGLQERIGMPVELRDGKLGRITQGYYEKWYGNTLAMKAINEAGGIGHE